MSSSETSNRDPLQNLLEDAQSELRRRLVEACEAEANGVSTASTEEIRKLEDDLLAAALAAKQTVAIRSQMKRRNYAERERPIKVDVAADRARESGTSVEGTPAPSVVDDVEKVVMGVHEFSDDDGKQWRAWSVVPGHTRASKGGQQFLGSFQDGWICFEGLSTSARRRLPYPRAKWANITDDELRALLHRAIDAPLRQKKGAQEVTPS